MPRLKLISSHGDQTLSRIRFVMYAPTTEEARADFLQAGLRFAEGQRIASANLAHAFEGDPAPARIYVMGPPNGFHPGYGVFTTAYVDRALKRVVGAPISYANGRKELAFYMDREVEQAREHIEAEVAEGYALDQRPTFVVEPRNIVGYFNTTPLLHSHVNRLMVLTNSLEPLDFEQFTESLAGLFRPVEPNTNLMAPSVVDDLLISTAESAVISRLRMMRWQGLAALGYEFYEGETRFDMPAPADIMAHKDRVLALQKLVEASQFFTGQLAWLRQYAMMELRIMLVELDEATE
jgi:hypothetical protein